MFDVILSIPAIIFGIRTTYTDVKYNKIKNLDVILAIIFGVIINLPKFGLGFVENVGIMFAIVFGLYMTGLLPPGDAKLLIAYSAVVPMNLYVYGVNDTFPSIALISNIFIPAMIIVIALSLKTINIKTFFSDAAKTFRPKNIVNIAINIFGLFYILHYLMSLANINFGRIGNLLLFMAVMQILNYVHAPLDKLAYVGGIIRIIIQWKELMSPYFYLNFFENIIYFQVLIFIVTYLTNFSFSTMVKIEDLKPGMRLAQLLKKNRNGYSTSNVLILNLRSFIKSGIKMIRGISVLDEKTIADLKKMKQKGKLNFEYLRIAQTFPFATFAFFGVILTIFIKGSISFYLITVKSYVNAYWKIFIYLIKQELIKVWRG